MNNKMTNFYKVRNECIPNGDKINFMIFIEQFGNKSIPEMESL